MSLVCCLWKEAVEQTSLAPPARFSRTVVRAECEQVIAQVYAGLLRVWGH